MPKAQSLLGRVLSNRPFGTLSFHKVVCFFRWILSFGGLSAAALGDLPAIAFDGEEHSACEFHQSVSMATVCTASLNRRGKASCKHNHARHDPW